MKTNQMPAGPELDALVAEKVMSLDVAVTVSTGETKVYFSGPDNLKPIPPYSTDIAAAWKVVEKLGLTRVTVWQEEPGPNSWVCFFGIGVNAKKRTYANTAPLAICRAALAAVEEP